MTCDVKVDCGMCNACCRAELVVLVEGDNPEDYDAAVSVPIDMLRTILPTAIGFAIPHGKDGACVYLQAGKCSIYDRRPIMCRAFTCVGYVKRILETTTRSERRKEKLTKTDVYRAGVARLRT